MYPRTEYEMTQGDLDAILDACKSVPVMMIGSYAPSSPQEDANAAWATLGRKMGFDHMTVKPISGKGNRFFTAVPSETEEARNVRLAREVVEATKREIARVTAEIEKLQTRLHELGEP